MRSLAKIDGYDKATEALRANLSCRYLELDLLERYVDGTQYEGMVPWLSSADVPVLERAPSVVEKPVAGAIRSYLALLLGDNRWPAISSVSDTDADYADMALSEDQSALLDSGIASLIKHAKVKNAARSGLEKAMACGTAVTAIGVKRGKVRLTNLQAKHCEPIWDDQEPERLTALDVRYPYLQRYKDGGRWKVRSVWYRRVIDEMRDTVFQPEKARKDGAEPEVWTVKHSVEHGYGFCPVVWWAFNQPDCDTDERDGVALHADLLDEIDALNRSCSQHNRAALYCGDPQWVEINVDPGLNPAPGGRTAEPMRCYPDERGDVKRKQQQWLTGEKTQTARKKGPGVVWTYPATGDQSPKVDMMTLPGDALDSIAKDRDDLRNMIAESMAWVRIDSMKSMKGSQTSEVRNLSGKAIEWMYRRQTSRCDTMRVDWFDNWMLPVISIMLRIVLHHETADSGALYLSGSENIASVAMMCNREVMMPDGTVESHWFPPEICANWPPYFQASESDLADQSDRVRKDLEAGLITKRTAIEAIAPQYGIDDIDAYHQQLDSTNDGNVGDRPLDALDQVLGGKP